MGHTHIVNSAHPSSASAGLRRKLQPPPAPLEVSVPHATLQTAPVSRATTSGNRCFPVCPTWVTQDVAPRYSRCRQQPSLLQLPQCRSPGGEGQQTVLSSGAVALSSQLRMMPPGSPPSSAKGGESTQDCLRTAIRQRSGSLGVLPPSPCSRTPYPSGRDPMNGDTWQGILQMSPK